MLNDLYFDSTLNEQTKKKKEKHDYWFIQNHSDLQIIFMIRN